MRQSDKDRITAIVEASSRKLDRSEAYDAIAFAERDESDAHTKDLLHQAALELMRSSHDKSELANVLKLLGEINPVG